MSEHLEDFLLEIEKKLFELSVKELQRACELCRITGKDNTDIQKKSRRALIKYIITFCEHDELLERDDEGMPVLLELNDTIDVL